MNKFRMMSILVILAMLFGFANVSAVTAATTAVTLQQSTATISQPQDGLFVYEAVDGITAGQDGNGLNGWATWTGSSTAQTAVWETSSDVNASRLDFALYHTWAASHSLGRFRLSYTTDDRSTFADGATENGDVTANWTVLTGPTISGTGGETFTVLGDESILVSGNRPATTIYSVSFEGSFNGITGIRLEALPDPSLPQGGAGRGDNGNWHLVEISLDATAAPGAIVQFDAATLALLNGEAVITWDGQNAAGNPTYLENQTPNGMPAVEFNGGGDRMGDNIPLLPSAAGDWIVVAVIKPDNIGAYHNLVDDDASNRPMLWIDPGFRYELNFGGGSGVRSAGTGTDGWDIVIADSRLNQLYVNSPTPNASGGGAIPFTATESFDFFNRDGNQTFQGLVAELRVYNDRADFGDDFAAVYSEMYTKWIQQAPTSVAGGPYNGYESSAIAMSGASASDADLDTLNYAWTVDSALCSFDDATALNPNLTCSDNGSYTASLSVEDGVNPAVSSDAAVTVDNVSPTIAINGASNVDEGSPYDLTLGAVTDPGTDTVSAYIVNWGDGNSDSLLAHTYADGPNTYAITVDLTDEDGAFLDRANPLSVTVDNVAPTLGAISVDVALVPVNTIISASAAFTDPGTLDMHTVVWDWGNGTTVGTVTQGSGSGSVSDNHSFSTPGVYPVTLIVTDNDGAPSNVSTSEYIVVYDPNAGFVTGSGQIDSPAGALVADPSATGKGKFGFNTKYKKDGRLESETEFELEAGEFHFHASNAQWLVINDLKGQFQGTGRVEGSNHLYGFRLTVVDGQATGQPDMFRLRIWDIDDGYVIVYDNELGLPAYDAPVTPISKGSIKIQTKK